MIVVRLKFVSATSPIIVDKTATRQHFCAWLSSGERDGCGLWIEDSLDGFDRGGKSARYSWGNCDCRLLELLMVIGEYWMSLGRRRCWKPVEKFRLTKGMSE